MPLPAILARLAAGAVIRGGADNGVDENDIPNGVRVNLGMSASMDTRALERRLKQLERRMPQLIDNALHKTAQVGASIISDRAARGVGVRLPFAPYSASYAEAKAEGWKASADRPSFSGDSSGVVNLNVTGRMWAALTTRKRRGYAVIYFSNAEANKKAFFNNERREFMGFSNNSSKRLFRTFKKEIFK